MGSAANRWRAVREARQSGDTALFWRSLMSWIGWGFVAVIVVAAVVVYLVQVL